MGTKFFFLLLGIIFTIAKTNSEPIQNDKTSNSVKSSRTEQWKLKRSLFPSQFSSPSFTSFQSPPSSGPLATVFSPVFPVGVYSSPLQQQIISSFDPQTFSSPASSDSYSIPFRSSPPQIDSYSIPHQEQKPERSFGIPNLAIPGNNIQSSGKISSSLSFNNNIYNLPSEVPPSAPSKPNQFYDLPSEAPTSPSGYGLPSEAPSVSTSYGLPSEAPTPTSGGYQSEPTKQTYYEIPKTNAWTVITSTVEPTQEYKIVPQDAYDPSQMKWRPLKEVTWTSVSKAYEESKGGYGYPDSTPSTTTESSVIQPSYGPPQQEYGPPKQEYGPPKQEYGPPKQEYGPPKQEYGPPKQEYGPPKQEYGPPKQEYGPPKQEYGPPKQEYGPPKQEYGPPKEEYGPPEPPSTTTEANVIQPSYGPPEHEYGAPLSEYTPKSHNPPPKPIRQQYGPPKEVSYSPKPSGGYQKGYQGYSEIITSYGPIVPVQDNKPQYFEKEVTGGYQSGHEFTEFSPVPYGPKPTEPAQKKKEIRFIIHKPGEEEIVKETVIEDSKKAGEEVSFIRGPWIEIDHKQKVHLPPPKKTVVYILLKEPQIKTTVQVNEPKSAEMPKPEVFIVYENSDGVIRKHYDLSPEESQKVTSLLGDKIRYARDSLGPHAISIAMNGNTISATKTTTTTIKPPPQAQEPVKTKTKKTSQ